MWGLLYEHISVVCCYRVVIATKAIRLIDSRCANLSNMLLLSSLLVFLLLESPVELMDEQSVLVSSHVSV